MLLQAFSHIKQMIQPTLASKLAVLQCIDSLFRFVLSAGLEVLYLKCFVDRNLKRNLHFRSIQVNFYRER